MKKHMHYRAWGYTPPCGAEVDRNEFLTTDVNTVTCSLCLTKLIELLKTKVEETNLDLLIRS